MAKNFLVDINLNKNELQNGIIQNLAANPSNPVAGQVYFNTTTNKFRIYNGIGWDEMGSGGGTVTSVGLTNGTDGSLTVTGSPITSSGTINIEHTNQIAAQTVSGIYPLKIDKTGHITEYGTALGNVSTTANGLMPSFSSGNTDSSNAVTNTDYIWDATAGKYRKLPANAFLNTTYTDGTAGYILKAKQDGDGNVIDTTYAPIASPTFTGTPTAPTPTSGDNTTKLATTAFVTSAVSGLIGAMHYKGTLGTGGTVTELPTSGVIAGDTYKVITAGTYAEQAAKVGDLFIAHNSTPTWDYVPSGDDTAVTSITAGTGLTGGTITTTGTIALATSGVSTGTYQGLTVDAYGRITNAQNMGYTTNTGTVTSVGITAGAGMSVSGGPITTNGLITVGHSNATTVRSSQAVYPIAIDAQGHITGSGTAVTILKKFASTITGNSSNTSFTITHNLNSRDVIIQVYDNSSFDEVIVDIVRTTANAATISFASAPITGTNYRVVVIG